MKVGLYFGTFNPIHNGHLIIANHLIEFSELEEIWLVVTPHNPHKQKARLLDDYHRLEMVRIAIENYPKLKASDIEFNLPQPNYTFDTLVYLEKKFPQHQFSLIIGEDNLQTFDKWKNYNTIIERHNIYVYPRKSITQATTNIFYSHSNIHRINAPIIGISSTAIRETIQQNRSVRWLLPEKISEYIQKNALY